MREWRKWRCGSKMTRAARRRRLCRVVKRVERFDGEEWRTSEAGLASYLRRFYRPDHGRWLNRDPIEERGGANLYGFCVNSPQLYVDVNGNVLLIDSLVLTAVGGIIGGVSAALSGGDIAAGIAGGAVSGFCISICPGAAAGCGGDGRCCSWFYIWHSQCKS